MCDVTADSSQAFPSMSVNLSMCMNVDVTTHDQLLLNPQRGHVVGRHALNSATQQFRDDPWTRYMLHRIELVKSFGKEIGIVHLI